MRELRVLIIYYSSERRAMLKQITLAHETWNKLWQRASPSSRCPESHGDQSRHDLCIQLARVHFTRAPLTEDEEWGPVLRLLMGCGATQDELDQATADYRARGG